MGRPPSPLKIRFVPLDSIERFAGNAKRHDIGGIVESIKRYGFRDPPAFDAQLNAVVEGNGRVEALLLMRDSGEQPPRGLRVSKKGDWLVPVLHGVDAASAKEAKAYLVDHNNLTVLGGDADVGDV